jgi:DNA anti-recombination protein RmuC
MSLSGVAIKLALKGFGGWLTASWKWIVISALMGVATYFWFSYKSGQQAKDDLEELTDGTIATLSQKVAEQAMEKQSLAKTIEMMQEQEAANDIRQDGMRDDLANIRQDMRDRVGVLEKRRKRSFESMLRAHPEMMEDLVNNATQKSIQELEDAFNN